MKKIRLEIIIPIIIAIILVAVFVYLDYRSDQISEPSSNNESVVKPEPISPSENPEREKELEIGRDYGCASPATIEPDVMKEPDSVWKINRDGEKTIVSLGKYRINNSAKMVLDVTKLWLYFFSEDLSDREDNLYGIKKSYVSSITLVVNGNERKLKLGGDKYMFIELDDYPLGDLYPYLKKTALEFEFLVELEYDGKEPLDYIDGADIQAQIRIFAVGCQEFTRDIKTSAKFEY